MRKIKVILGLAYIATTGAIAQPDMPPMAHETSVDFSKPVTEIGKSLTEITNAAATEIEFWRTNFLATSERLAVLQSNYHRLSSNYTVLQVAYSTNLINEGLILQKIDMNAHNQNSLVRLVYGLFDDYIIHGMIKVDQNISYSINSGMFDTNNPIVNTNLFFYNSQKDAYTNKMSELLAKDLKNAKKREKKKMPESLHGAALLFTPKD